MEAQSRNFAVNSGALSGFVGIPLATLTVALAFSPVVRVTVTLLVPNPSGVPMTGIGNFSTHLIASIRLRTAGSAHRLVGEVLQTDLSRNEGAGHAVLETELAFQPGCGPMMDEQLLVKGARPQLDRNDLVGLDPLLRDVQCTVYRRMGKAAGWVRLDGNADRTGYHKCLTQVCPHRGPVNLVVVSHDLGKPQRRLDNALVGGKPRPGQKGCLNPVRSRFARVQRFGHGAEVLP